MYKGGFLTIVMLLIAIQMQALEVPYLSARVNDYANILSADTERYLEQQLKVHEDSTSNQIAILTIPSLEGEHLESYSMQVVETWKLGQEGKDNGVLLLVAINDRKIRIEVGYGLEWNLTDAKANRIIRNTIAPYFRQGNYNAGITNGALAMIETIEGSYVNDGESLAAGDGELIGATIFAFIFLFIMGVPLYEALLTPGPGSWITFIFMTPFFMVVPSVMLGQPFGIILFLTFFFGFLFLKLVFFNTTYGQELMKRHAEKVRKRQKERASRRRGWTTHQNPRPGGGWIYWDGGSSSDWGSSSGGGFGGGFGGGGGSFGGGGSSGGW